MTEARTTRCESVDAMRQAISQFDKQADAVFVAAVRQAERQYPDIKTLVEWNNEVRRELDFRLLLKR